MLIENYLNYNLTYILILINIVVMIYYYPFDVSGGYWLWVC